MIVSELIDLLRKLPPALPVRLVYYTGRDDHADFSAYHSLDPVLTKQDPGYVTISNKH